MYNPKTPHTQTARLTDASNNIPERSERLFTHSGMWYFRTREGKDVGPFRYKDEAELMLTRFVQELQQLQQEAMVSVKPHFRISGVVGRRHPG